MANGSGSGSGVAGAGGVATPAGRLANAVGAVPPACTPGTAGCPRHRVRAELRNLDDNSIVQWAKCSILMNGAVKINGGPLSAGFIESIDIPATSYSVIFPEIDAKEWWEG